MNFIGFRDSCVIERMTGRKDEWDNLIMTTIYTGECLYEEGGSGYNRSFIVGSPTVFLPENDVIIETNDSVTITTEKGRVINAVAKKVRDINMPWRTNIRLTRVELKLAKEE